MVEFFRLYNEITVIFFNSYVLSWSLNQCKHNPKYNYKPVFDLSRQKLEDTNETDMFEKNCLDLGENNANLKLYIN